MVTDKKELRSRLKKLRDEMSANERKEKSSAICRTVSGLKEYINASQLLCYAAIGSEADMTELINSALLSGKKVALPKTENGIIRFYTVNSLEKLEKGMYNIPEPPKYAETADILSESICIVPAIGFDCECNRIGYGKGYYDAFLRDYKGVAVIAAFSCSLVKKIPSEPHDIAALMAVTESCIYKK